MADPSDVRAVAAESGWGARMLTRLITLRSDPATLFKGKLGRESFQSFSSTDRVTLNYSLQTCFLIENDKENFLKSKLVETGFKQ